MPFQEPQLSYQPATRRWEGENEEYVLWMDDAVFSEYVHAWMALHAVGRTPQEQAALATEHCRRFCYWRGCERNYDRRVHLLRKPVTHVLFPLKN